MDIQEDKYYSAEEVSDLIDNLDSATLTKLYKIASILGGIYRYDAESLVHDTIVKLLEPEARRWRKEYSIFTIFKNICWSLLNHHNNHYKSCISLNEPYREGEELIDSITGGYRSPESQLLIVDIRDQIFNPFKDDPIAKDLIEGQMEGYTKSELLDLFEISNTEYETTWKRIRRKMRKEYQGSKV